MSTKKRLSKRISTADWAAGKRENSMMKAIIKSTMQDGTPEDVTEVRKSIRELLLDSRASTTTKVPELSPSQAQQVLAQVSTLLAELDSGQAATEWAKKGSKLQKESDPLLDRGPLDLY
jgi:hypothetical protein